MEENKNPLSPHLQVYRWQIHLFSQLHRIVGVLNFFIITLICVWALSLLLGQNNYDL